MPDAIHQGSRLKIEDMKDQKDQGCTEKVSKDGSPAVVAANVLTKVMILYFRPGTRQASSLGGKP
jgi:hypothetical protein